MSAEDIFSKPLTDDQRAVLQRMAAQQEVGDDSDIDYSDIPPLTDEQLASAVRGKPPIYLERRVLDMLTEIATRKGVEVNDLVNEVLKKELAIAEVLR